MLSSICPTCPLLCPRKPLTIPLAFSGAHEGLPTFPLAFSGAHESLPTFPLTFSGAHEGLPDIPLAFSGPHEGLPASSYTVLRNRTHASGIDTANIAKNVCFSPHAERKIGVSGRFLMNRGRVHGPCRFRCHDGQHRGGGQQCHQGQHWRGGGQERGAATKKREAATLHGVAASRIDMYVGSIYSAATGSA